ncbi:putative pentatricopeptide repeat-containing protein, partial [Camellia lanceoleosa]
MGSLRWQGIYLGLLGEANDFLVMMEGMGCMPNHATYNVMVRGFLKANDYTEANILAEKMIGRGFSADASTLGTVVDLLLAKGQDPTLFHMIKKL